MNYDNWKLDSGESNNYSCDRCEEYYHEHDLHEYGRGFYCDCCIEKLMESGSGNDLNDLIYAMND